MSYRNEETTAVLTLTAASAGADSPALDVAYGKGIMVFVNITAITGTSPTLTVTLQGRGAGVYYTILVSGALNATGLTVLRVFPGIAAVANVAASDIIPPTVRISTAIGGTGPSVTATITTAVIE